MSSSTETQIDELRKIIADEEVSITERKAVAEHIVQLVVDAVPTPQDDDTEVVALMTPPLYDGILADMDIMPRAWAIANEQRRWAATGPTVPQARRHVHERRRTKLLESIYRNRELHGLEREAAAQRLLDSLPASSMQRRNGITAQRLIAEAS